MLIPESIEHVAARDATPTIPSTSLEELRRALPEEAADLRLNLQSVLGEGALSPGRRFGVAVAVAYASSDRALAQALEAEAGRHLDSAALAAVIEDARTAAAIMSMNNVFYRFRHLVGKPGYAQLPARLRMNRLAKPRTSKADLELFSLAVSAVNGCESCVQSHENVVVTHGLTEQQVHDAIRIAATVHAVSVVRSW
jgi:alkyl hydroperoxide reductase subunit D